MHSASEALAGIAFGRFLLLPHRRELLAEGRPIKLGGRAFDVLMALIEARGAVVSKHALMARVWPDRIVEENNLQWQISALRAAFGADRNLIHTVSGRGYQFTAEIDTPYDSPEADAGTAIADAPRDPREARRDGGRRASLGCYAIRAVPPRPWRFSNRSTTVSPRGSTRST
jgi:DNA-binding winged helix-turn-helix (wHTH) protein